MDDIILYTEKNDFNAFDEEETPAEDEIKKIMDLPKLEQLGNFLEGHEVTQDVRARMLDWML